MIVVDGYKYWALPGLTCHGHPTEANNVLFDLSASPYTNNLFLVPTHPLGEREQNALTWDPPGFHCPLRSSLRHKPVPKGASRTSWLPNYRKCPRASITAVAQVYRVAKAVWWDPPSIVAPYVSNVYSVR